MKTNMRLLSLSVLLPLVIVTACGLLSGTFVIERMFHNIDFTTQTGLYNVVVDMSEDEDWEEHEDQIEGIDAIGFEIWITNNEAESAEFNIYLDELEQPVYASQAELDSAGVPKILDGLEIDPGANFLSYGQSLGYLTNVEYMKTRVAEGTFMLYGTSDIGTTDGYHIDSLRVIVTVTVSY